MADEQYGAVSDVAANVRSLFPNGFSATTSPTGDEVTQRLAQYQAIVRQILKRKLTAAELPDPFSDAGQIASAAVVAGTTAWVLSVALQTRSGGEEIVGHWRSEYHTALRQLREMPEELREVPEQEIRFRSDDPVTRRPANWTDADLDGSNPRW